MNQRRRNRIRLNFIKKKRKIRNRFVQRLKKEKKKANSRTSRIQSGYMCSCLMEGNWCIGRRLPNTLMQRRCKIKTGFLMGQVCRDALFPHLDSKEHFSRSVATVGVVLYKTVSFGRRADRNRTSCHHHRERAVKSDRNQLWFVLITAKCCTKEKRIFFATRSQEKGRINKHKQEKKK